MLHEILGSGGGVNSSLNINTRGGGAIGLFSKSFTLFGRIDASGFPTDLNLFNQNDRVSGGSGGFIHISQINISDDSPQSQFGVTKTITTNGGLGSQYGFSGSGGRIFINLLGRYEDLVHDNDVTSSRALEKPFTMGKDCENGAVGTVYYNNSRKLSFKGWPSTKTDQKSYFRYNYTTYQKKTLKLLEGIDNAIIAPQVDEDTQGTRPIEAKNIKLIKSHIINPFRFNKTQVTQISCDYLCLDDSSKLTTGSSDTMGMLKINAS